MKGLPKTEQILLSEEEMQRLHFDGRPIRHYCVQCRGPKLMVPTSPTSFHEDLAEMKLPEKLSITCKTCHAQYKAKLAAASKPASAMRDQRKTEHEVFG